MRKSRTINLLLLGGSILAFSTCICGGCGRNQQPSVRVPYDPPWHDAQGKPIAKEWKMDENGHRTPVQTPYDSAGKPIQFDANGNPIAPAGYAYSTTSGGSHYRSGGIGWWPYIFSGRTGSGYGSSYGSGYRSRPTNTGSTYFGGTKPGSSSKPSGGSSLGGSISRGGFGGSSSSAGS